MYEAKVVKLAKEPAVWINSAFILYFTPFFFYNILFNAMLESSRTLLSQISDVNALIVIIEYGLVAIGFWKTGKQESNTLKA
jgi:hypothetical protein